MVPELKGREGDDGVGVRMGIVFLLTIDHSWSEIKVPAIHHPLYQHLCTLCTPEVYCTQVVPSFPPFFPVLSWLCASSTLNAANAIINAVQ